MHLVLVVLLLDALILITVAPPRKLTTREYIARGPGVDRSDRVDATCMFLTYYLGV